ncbi:MAG: hypothetical protein H6Q48_1489 [Deltaproteobacteria bacterium]|nr:hypothetical protein [Deltaproteobacteria bacterium]NTV59142.1 hypothetical protein [Deltaproteobacteria bacterium]
MSSTNFSMVVEPKLFEKFLQLLQKGVKVTGRIGSSVLSFLCDDLGLSPEYVDKRIQTLFLNGKAIDNPDTSFLKEDSTLALSAAMPGVLGATLRKGGRYARMRSEISYQEQNTGISVHEGFVLLKLFNLLPAEIGPSVLARGIWLKGEELNHFLKELPDEVLGMCSEAKADGQAVNLKDFGEKSSKYELVLVRIQRS